MIYSFPVSDMEPEDRSCLSLLPPAKMEDVIEAMVQSEPGLTTRITVIQSQAFVVDADYIGKSRELEAAIRRGLMVLGRSDRL